MTVTDLIMMLVVGTVVGALGRLVVPGRQPIPLGLTVTVGIVAAFVALVTARALGVPLTFGIDWVALLIQVVVAAIGVATAANLYVRRGLSSSYRPGAAPARPAASPIATPTRNTAEFVQQRRAPTTPPPSRIFVSYRRNDSRHAAARMAEALRDRFGRTDVFMDYDSLEKGVDFVDGVLQEIRASAVVLVVIGDGWLAATDGRGRRRLDDPDDNVRIEIEQALRLQKTLLPVLLDGVPMPRPEELPDSIARLTRRNAASLDYLSWDKDVAELIEAVARMRS